MGTIVRGVDGEMLRQQSEGSISSVPLEHGSLSGSLTAFLALSTPSTGDASSVYVRRRLPSVTNSDNGSGPSRVGRGSRVFPLTASYG